MAALTSSDYTLTASGSTQTWSGDRLTVTRPTAGQSAVAVGNVGYNSGIIIFQAMISWGKQYSGGNEDIIGISLTSVTPTPTAYTYDDQYGAKICSRALNFGCFRYFGGAATYSSYNKQDGTVLCATDVRIVYDVGASTIKYQWWDGTSWATETTTQNYNILNGGSLKPVLFYDNISGSDTGLATFEKTFCGTYGSEYSTHYPDSTAELSGVLGQSAFSEMLLGGSVTYTAPGKIEMTRPSSNPTFVRVKLNKDDRFVIVQANFTWQTSSVNEDFAGIILHSQYPSSTIYDIPYSAKITTRASAGGLYRLFAGAATYNSYSLDTAVAKGKDVKIVFDTATNKIGFWQWSGSWVRMGTEQTYAILNSKSLWATFFYYNLGITSLGTVTYDTPYFGSYDSDYATQYPPSTGTDYKKFTMFF